ncbi:hypothetical protein AB0M92_36620 [Streptomyces sp. NPDC051582]|uniref:hypothetical protein n=1 Tax=Streptomyces sp. NPDC051582 TaxID=3155167 RepID=UPI00343E3BC2
MDVRELARGLVDPLLEEHHVPVQGVQRGHRAGARTWRWWRRCPAGSGAWACSWYRRATPWRRSRSSRCGRRGRRPGRRRTRSGRRRCHGSASSRRIVVSTAGSAHLLTSEHIRPHHRVVVDSGFSPQPDGSFAGDMHPSATSIPQNITPVPGGVGPVEMAVLMERIVRQVTDPDLQPWSFPRSPYLTHRTSAARMRSGGRAPGTSTSRPVFRPGRGPPAYPEHEQ